MKSEKEIIEEINENLDRKQNEYFGLITGFQKDGTPVDNELHRTRFLYKWERMKDLQKDIFNLVYWEREKSIELTKQQLEQAFTPRIQKMLKDSVKENIENSDG